MCSPYKDKVNLFEVLKHILDEIISLSSLRLKKVAEQKSPSYKFEIERLKKKKAEYEDLLYKLEDSNIREIKEELSRIKGQEVKMGELEGKNASSSPKVLMNMKGSKNLNFKLINTKKKIMNIKQLTENTSR